MSFKIAGIFFCSTLLIIGSIVLLKDMSLEYNAVMNACFFSITGAIIAGSFGFFIGKILETPAGTQKNNRPNRPKKSVIKEPEFAEEDNLN